MAKTKILVVEDEVIVARDLQQGLIELGYDVPDIAISASEAIDKVRDSRPDLVLMDIHLKGERDGIEAAAELRQRFEIPVVYLTAFADAATLGRAKLTEPFGYILKPCQQKELHTTIEISLYKHQMEQKLRAAHAELQQAHDELTRQLAVAEGRDRLVQCQMRGPTQEEAHEVILQVLNEAMPVESVWLYLPREQDEDQMACVLADPPGLADEPPAGASPADACAGLVEEARRTGRPQCDDARSRAAVPILYRHKVLGVLWAVAAADVGSFSQQSLNGMCSLAAQAALLLRMAAVTAAVSDGSVAADQLLDLD